MHTRANHRRVCRTSYEGRLLGWGARRSVPTLLLLLAAAMLSACGGSGSSTANTQVPLTLSGNWQFTISPQVDANNQVLFLGGLEGGFLLQNSGSAKGSSEYAISLPGVSTPCNSGSAAITGTISGQAVNLTAVAGTQTFTLTGTLSLDSSTMSGTYTSTAGTASDGSACGSAEPPTGSTISGLQWSAALVPSITGPFQGSILSTGGSTGLQNESFQAWGTLTQGQNTGASSATVTGTLNVNSYPCFGAESVTGQISGNSVTLQIVGSDNSTLGQVGVPASSNGATGLNPVNVESQQGGYVLNGVAPSYMVATTGCPGSLDNVDDAGNYGTICLGLNGTSCTQAADVKSAAVQHAGTVPYTHAHSGLTVASPINGTSQDVERHHAEVD